MAKRLVRKAIDKLGASLADDEHWRITRAILSAANEESRQAGARFALFFIPYGRIDVPSRVAPLLAKWAQSEGVPYLDLQEHFIKLPAADRSRLYRGHWTPYGNEVVAQLVDAFVTRERLLDRRETNRPADTQDPAR